jgi:rubrerythrin
MLRGLVDLATMLSRCAALEARAAALYRSWAAGARDRPELCALWTQLAREEEEHARALAEASTDLPPAEGWRTEVTGWDEAVRAADEALSAAERLHGAGADIQLAAALELESTELDALRALLLVVTHHAVGLRPPRHHVVALAEAAERLSRDPHVLLQAALLRARGRLEPPVA